MAAEESDEVEMWTRDVDGGTWTRDAEWHLDKRQGHMVRGVETVRN